MRKSLGKWIILNHILRITAILVLLALFSLFSLSGDASAHTNPQHYAKGGFSFHSMKGSFSFHLLQTDNLTFQSLSMKPNTYPPEPCLSVTVTASNPQAEHVHIMMSLFNTCGGTLSNIGWDYTSTAICNGQAYSGPNNSGTLGSLSYHYGITVASDYWWEECIDSDNGFVTNFGFSVTGTAQGYFRINGQNVEGYGSDTTPEYNFF